MIIYNGSDYNRLYTARYKDGVNKGLPYPLTGYTMTSEIRDGDGLLLFTYTVENVDLANGEFRLKLLDIDMAGLEEQVAYSDILFSHPTSPEFRSPKVLVTLKKGVTLNV